AVWIAAAAIYREKNTVEAAAAASRSEQADRHTTRPQKLGCCSFSQSSNG
ncbi:hypothetical protein Zm00014a_022369, partial [Zea mays]